MGGNAVAIFGLGLMGAAFARHLHGSGTTVVGWNRSPDKGRTVASDGVAVCDDAVRAIERAGLIVLLPGRCDQAHGIFAGIEHLLAGKDVLNLASGTPRLVRELGAMVESAGASFASGTVLFYPGDIGKAEATIMISGDAALWHRHRGTLLSLAGASAYIGDNPAAACALEAALVGCVVQPAQAGFIEAARFLRSEGVASDLLAGFLPGAMQSIQRHNLIALEQIAGSDFSTSEPPISNYTRSQSLFVEALHDAAVPAQIASALLAKLDHSEKAGDGGLAFAAIYRG